MRSRPVSFITGLLMLLVLTMGACTSRYRMDFYMDLEEVRKKVDVDDAQYVMDVDLGDPLADEKLTVGSGSVAIVSVNTRWKSRRQSDFAMLNYDENLRFQIYVQLPGQLQPDSSELVGQSFAQMLGRYDQAPGRKTFMANSGFWRIDSVASGHLFMTLQGEYENNVGTAVTFDGRFKVQAHL